MASIIAKDTNALDSVRGRDSTDGLTLVLRAQNTTPLQQRAFHARLLAVNRTNKTLAPHNLD